MVDPLSYFSFKGVRYSSVVRAFAHDAMVRRIDMSDIWSDVVHIIRNHIMSDAI